MLAVAGRLFTCTMSERAERTTASGSKTGPARVGAGAAAVLRAAQPAYLTVAFERQWAAGVWLT